MKLDSVCIKKDDTMINAMEKIKNCGFRCIIVTNQIGAAIASLSEGDILDGILRGQSIHSPISNFFNRNFTYIHKNDVNTASGKNSY